MNKLDQLYADNRNMKATLENIKDWRDKVQLHDETCNRTFCEDIEKIEQYAERTLARNLL
jgi:hypothetical protein